MDHLSGGPYSLPNAEIHDDPRQQQAQGQVPLDSPRVAHTGGQVEDFAPVEISTLERPLKTRNCFVRLTCVVQ